MYVIGKISKVDIENLMDFVKLGFVIRVICSNMKDYIEENILSKLWIVSNEDT